MEKIWQCAELCPAEFVSRAPDGSPLLAQLLWQRGVREPKDIAAFISPSWHKHMHDPGGFRHMVAAVSRIFTALEQGERIVVHGDYDADGVTGSTVLLTTLRELAKHIPCATADELHHRLDFYIPHRDKEGYGLHTATVLALAALNTRLIITVDCGIACVAEIATARTHGVDVIVVDHHEFAETLPDAHLIHPRLPGETYPFPSLAAVGVSFKLACALLIEARKRGLPIIDGWEKWLLDLVAIATVTDVVPLIGENRVLETYGLKVLRKMRRPGLQALCEISGLTPEQIDTESIGFTIGPRLNAAGRMDHASLALRLLLTETIDEARPLAQEIEKLNRARQDVTREMMREAEVQFTQRYGARELPAIIVLWSSTWSPALVGLVAGKWSERLSRPTIVIGHHEGIWIGSGRSIKTFDITAAMRAAGDGLLNRVGGHMQACGFALSDANAIPIIMTRLEVQAAQVLQDGTITPIINIDMEVTLDEVSLNTLSLLEKLEPYGEKNPRPIFLSRECRVVAVDLLGSQKQHLRLTLLSPRGQRVKAVGFNLASLITTIGIGSRVDCVYTMSRNAWNGRVTAECRLLDLKVAI